MKRLLSKKFLYPAAFVMLILISIAYNLLCKGRITGRGGDGIVINRNSEDINASQETESTDPVLTESEDRIVSIYICGEVNRPGVYELYAGDLLNDAVIMAGGLTENAAADRINLVYEFDSNISVYIPSVEDDIDTQNGNEGVYDVRDLSNDPDSDSHPIASSAEEGVSLININTASREELMTLPGIGEVTAESIIEYRENKTFDDIRELMNVSGIGEGRFARISGLICVG